MIAVQIAATLTFAAGLAVAVWALASLSGGTLRDLDPRTRR